VSASARIERIETHVVSLPLDEPIAHAFLGARTQFAHLIVELHASDGSVGLGYASIENIGMVRALEHIVRAMEPIIIGSDPGRRALTYERLWGASVDLLHDGAVNLALAALDVALWDLHARQCGQPLWKLLGGYRDRVQAYASWALWRHHDIDRLQRDASALVEQGFTAMKLRLGGALSANEDMARARAVREAVGPKVHIMVDALWGSSIHQGITMARMLGQLGYTWLEEPVREGDFDGLAQIRAAQALPIAAGERISRVEQLARLIPCIDHAILDAHHLGGITPWQKAAMALDTCNLPISAHSHPFVHMHLLASMRTGAWVEYMPWWDALFIDPPKPVDGLLVMSDQPGLGLTLDRAALKRFAVA